MPSTRLLIRTASAAALVLGLLALPVAAPAPPPPATCACADGFPLESPDLCYEQPGAAIGDFAYVAPSDFLQVVGFGAGGYCRHNAAFTWLDGPGTLACEEFIGCLCNNPSPGPEVCDDGIDNDCDGRTDWLDADCASLCPCFEVADGNTVWASSFASTECAPITSLPGYVLWAGTPGPMTPRLSTTFEHPSSGTHCDVDDEDTSNVQRLDCTPDEHRACVASLAAIAAEDGVACPPAP